MRGRLVRTFAGLAALAAALLVWAFVIGPSGLRNEDYDLALPGWPAACDGTRVAVLTDLHVGSPFNGIGKLHRVVALTQDAHPDLVLLAGDYVITDVPGGHFTPPEEIAGVLGALSAPLGVWAVLGNHDRWFDGARVQRALETAGIPVLEDESRRLEHGGCAFWLAGIGDYWTTRHDVGAALAQVSDSAPVLLFTHNPDVFPEVPDGVALSIAGHTHGGQVYIPFVGRPIVPSKYHERFAIGPIVEGGRHYFVSSGVGTSILPVRFLVTPEVSVLSLRAGG
jgi:predicted MPP superfamily phosphohydrolase